MVVDVLHHLLAPLVLEVDVDVGRLLAVERDEALEQQVVQGGVDLGDAEAEAQGRVRRRSPALAQDAARAGEAHDVVHGQEVGRVVHLPHEIEFVGDGRRDVPGNAVGVGARWVATARAFGSEGGERLLRRGKALAQLLGIVVAEFVEREGEAGREAQGLGHGLGRFGEQPAHLGRRLQVALGVERQLAAGALQRDAVADAGDDVEQRRSRGIVHGDVVGGEHRHAEPVGELAAAEQVAARTAAVGHYRANPEPAGAGGN